jgi:hypothetical protein
MTLQAIFWTVLAVMFVALPIMMGRSMIVHLGGKGSERTGSGGISAGIGAAMVELDRILARPSIEHLVETEHPVLKREDDSGED